MDVFVDRKPILELVRKAQVGMIVLPEFQRDFVWSREAVKDLLTSVLMNYYIGALLLLRTDESHLPFQSRFIAGVVNKEDIVTPEFMVLDGQQRMTSLHYAFAAPPIPLRDTRRPYRYFLNLRQVVDDKNVEEAIFFEREDRYDRLLKSEYQYDNFIVPFTELLRFDDWLNGCDNWYYARDRRLYEDVYRTTIRQCRGIAKRFENFNVPTNEIGKVSPSDNASIEKICAIFEKLNSTGVSLSVFDLLTARLFPFGIRLRDLWQEAFEGSTLIQSYAADDVTGYQVLLLRTVGLMRGKDVKARNLIDLDARGFKDVGTRPLMLWHWRLDVFRQQTPMDSAQSHQSGCHIRQCCLFWGQHSRTSS